MSNVKGKPLHQNVPDYTLKMTKQKGIRMRVTARGELIVHANPFHTKEDLDSFVLKHINEMNFTSSVRLFGKSLLVRKVKGNLNKVSYGENELVIQYKEKDQIEDLYNHFLKHVSDEVFADILDMVYLRFSNYDVQKPNIIVRNLRSSWGICHPDKNLITLNAQLVHYPVDFIEYVICHEMIHLIEPNHSSSFYALLEEIMPDYKRRLDLIETNTEKQYLM